MLRIASAAFVLFTALFISIGVLPSSSAEANGTRYLRGAPVYGPPAVVRWRTGTARVAFRGPYTGYAYRGGYRYRAGHYRDYVYPVGYFGGYRSTYYEPRVIVVAPYGPAPYYVNGCYNGFSDNGVYCYVYDGCP